MTGHHRKIFDILISFIFIIQSVNLFFKFAVFLAGFKK